VHGPLCSRIPGLAWYIQIHLDREQDDHLWPAIDGIECFPDYVLDGGVEIGFASAQDQKTFMDACHLLFADEQNMFAETIAYDLPNRPYTPPTASVAELRSHLASLGLSRVVLIQPSFYGTDNRCLTESLARLGPMARGVAVIDDRADSAALVQLNDVGVRGVRSKYPPAKPGALTGSASKAP